MKLKNSSKIYSDKLIRDIIDFVRPSGISNFDVMIKNSDYSFAGRAYTQGCGYHETANPFIVIRIAPNIKFPYIRNKNKGYLPLQLYSNVEVAVYLIAHELRHLWQAKVKKGWRVWGAKGQFSERDASAYGIHKVREWRRK